MPLAACWQPARSAPWQWSRPALRDWNWSRFLSSCFPVHRALSFTVHARMKNYPQRTFTAPSTVDNAQGEQRNTASGGNKKRLGHTSKKRDHALTASRTALSPETAMASLKALCLKNGAMQTHPLTILPPHSYFLLLHESSLTLYIVKLLSSLEAVNIKHSQTALK